jgi:putative ubiquitin-RnfH superfamily antitoxin RatB of RatAB toxin-antitoxin module
MAEESTRRLRIEVAFGWPDRQILKSLSLPGGATVREAVEGSGILDVIRERDPAYELRDDRVGVFGQRVGLGDRLRDGDRVELYRPLVADPKEARRARAEADRAEADRARSTSGDSPGEESGR